MVCSLWGTHSVSRVRDQVQEFSRIWKSSCRRRGKQSGRAYRSKVARTVPRASPARALDRETGAEGGAEFILARPGTVVQGVYPACARPRRQGAGQLHQEMRLKDTFLSQNACK